MGIFSWFTNNSTAHCNENGTDAITDSDKWLENDSSTLVNGLDNKRYVQQCNDIENALRFAERREKERAESLAKQVAGYALKSSSVTSGLNLIMTEHARMNERWVQVNYNCGASILNSLCVSGLPSSMEGKGLIETWCRKVAESLHYGMDCERLNEMATIACCAVLDKFGYVGLCRRCDCFHGTMVDRDYIVADVDRFINEYKNGISVSMPFYMYLPPTRQIEIAGRIHNADAN